ncbi:MAG: hypothetical protein GY898_22850 [Proteobacteria bacterium]|nr:hypothetical protein [Pseudomonadota bacterium]
MSDAKNAARLSRWTERGTSIEANVTVKKREETGTATVYVAELDGGARFKRAAKIGLICWGLAVLSIPIVVFHFVLVPMFLLAGPVLFFMRYGQEQVILGSLVDCPVCSHTNRVKEQAEAWPITHHCDNNKCRETMFLARPGDEPA